MERGLDQLGCFGAGSSIFPLIAPEARHVQRPGYASPNTPGRTLSYCPAEPRLSPRPKLFLARIRTKFAFSRIGDSGRICALATLLFPNFPGASSPIAPRFPQAGAFSIREARWSGRIRNNPSS